ncbi:hypothetical protein Tco_0134374 [Tanacetum coccineum]
MTTIVYGANVVASSSSGRISNADVIGTENDSLDRNSATRTDNSLAQSEYHGSPTGYMYHRMCNILSSPPPGRKPAAVLIVFCWITFPVK